MMLPHEDPTTLSLLFHLNSEPWLNTEAYQAAFNYEVEYKEMTDPGAAQPLPLAAETPLLRLLRARQSCRRYQPRMLSQSALGTLLGGAYGITRQTALPERGDVMLHRGVPSAGALFPLEMYASVQNVEAVADGLHHYNVRGHALEPLLTGRVFAEAHNAMMTDLSIQNANLIVFLAAVFERTQKKYGPRGYRYILLEAGHVAQNLCLLATEQGLGSLCMGGFFDARLNRLLGLDTGREAVVYLVVVGHPAPAS